jgi:hypothetical protein
MIRRQDDTSADTVPLPAPAAHRVRVRLHPPTPPLPRTAAGRAGWVLLLMWWRAGRRPRKRVG